MPRSRRTQRNSKKTTVAPTRHAKSSVTLDAVTEQAKSVELLYRIWLADDGEDANYTLHAEAVYKDYVEEKAALVKLVKPLLDLLAEGDCFGAVLRPDRDSEREENLYFSFPVSRIDDEGNYTLVFVSP